MSTSWIKVRHGVLDDPKILSIAFALETDPLHILGAMVKFWIVADRHSQDGVIGINADALDHMVKIKGFGQQLVKVDWIVDLGNAIQIIGWDKHNGYAAKRKCVESARMKRFRDKNGGHE